jgi:hypothetical protein
MVFWGEAPEGLVTGTTIDALSRPLYYGALFGGLRGNWVDRTACQRSGTYDKDPGQHLAKVGVAGSNLVVRSISEALSGASDARSGPSPIVTIASPFLMIEFCVCRPQGNVPAEDGQANGSSLLDDGRRNLVSCLGLPSTLWI